jgi:hypothetical protein
MQTPTGHLFSFFPPFDDLGILLLLFKSSIKPLEFLLEIDSKEKENG